MGAIKAPAGAKLYGVNIVPTPTEVGTGVAAWANLHVDWPWDAWIKPQIDSAASNGIGCNCIRMIGDFLGVFTRLFSQATYNEHWTQLVSYCAKRGVYVIVTGGDHSQVSEMIDRDIESNVISLLDALSSFDNVAYVDVMQEQDAWGVGNAAARTNAIYAAIKATTSLPLTFSSVRKLTDNDSSGWIESIKTSCDVLDFHIYKALGYNGTPPFVATDLNRWQATYPDKEMVFGEVGSPESDGEAENRAFVGNVFKLVARDPRLRSCCLWAAQDQGTTAQLKYGLFDAHWNPRYAFRTALRQVTGGSVVRPH
jgi:regulator of sigma D